MTPSFPKATTSFPTSADVKERDSAVFRENLALLRQRKRDADTLTGGQFYEAAARYAAEERERRHTLTSEEAPETAAGLYRGLTGETDLVTPAFASFCRAFGSQFPQAVTWSAMTRRGEETEGEALPPEVKGRTSYLRNGYTDSAYRIFSREVKGMTAAYNRGYAAACEDVYYGRSGYVILPLYSASGGRLATFGSLLTKYDLTVAMACLVASEEGEDVIYALCRRGAAEEAGELIDLSVILPDEVPPSAFFAALEGFGLRLLLVSSVPLPYTEDTFARHELFLHLLAENADTAAFALFLEAAQVRYRMEGRYGYLRGAE